MSYPPCFDSNAQYQDWVKAAEEAEYDKRHPTNFCNDCLPEYKRRMLMEGRCEHPGVKFIRIGIKAFFGRRAPGDRGVHEQA